MLFEDGTFSGRKEEWEECRMYGCLLILATTELAGTQDNEG